jgi:ankyrin repeat protein
MAAKLSEMANALESHEDSSLEGEANIWSAADKGDTAKLKELLDKGRDVNCRNCLGCTPLLYACGSGHIDTVRFEYLQNSQI